MKVLLDHNLDRRLKGSLALFHVATVQECGWSDMSNGRLLAVAEADGFDVMITADSSISKQQNMTGRSISIVVIRAPNNRLETHKEVISELIEALGKIKPGQIVEVLHSLMKS